MSYVNSPFKCCHVYNDEMHWNSENEYEVQIETEGLYDVLASFRYIYIANYKTTFNF